MLALSKADKILINISYFGEEDSFLQGMTHRFWQWAVILYVMLILQQQSSQNDVIFQQNSTSSQRDHLWSVMVNLSLTVGFTRY